MFGQIFSKLHNLNKQKMVFIVRKDIKMGTGKIASQCAHAAVSLVTKSANDPLQLWMLNGQPKIVLKIHDNCENTLNNIYKAAKQQNLNAVLIYDAGNTQVKSGTLTVLGIGPNNSEDIDKLTQDLKLL